MNTFDYLFAKARENGKVAEALSKKLQTEVDKNNLVDEIGKIDVGAVVQAAIKNIGIKLETITTDESEIRTYRYQNRTGAVSVDLPNAVTIGSGSIRNCVSLTFLNLPNVVTIGSEAFRNNISLKSLDLHGATSIGEMALSSCISLTTLILGANQVVTLSGISALQFTPFSNGTGFIYVPDTLVDSYKTATNWSVYANQIRPMSECEV